MRLVLGIGNPGARYETTRHNVGFRAVDRLAAQRGVAFRKADALAMEAAIADRALVVKPLTFVNRSGAALMPRIGLLDGGLDRLLVVVDDVNLALGRLRLRARGSSGGHNGLADIAAALAREDFPRLRIGVGGAAGTELREHVLGAFGADEEEELEKALDRAARVIGRFVDGEPLQQLMATCNRVDEPNGSCARDGKESGT